MRTLFIDDSSGKLKSVLEISVEKMALRGGCVLLLDVVNVCKCPRSFNCAIRSMLRHQVTRRYGVALVILDTEFKPGAGFCELSVSPVCGLLFLPLFPPFGSYGQEGPGRNWENGENLALRFVRTAERALVSRSRGLFSRPEIEMTFELTL